MTETLYFFLIFLFSSFVGFFIETLLNSIENKKLMNRGFLIGPLCPIYGIGTVSSILLLKNIDNLLLVFIICTIGGAVIEYIISITLEKLFHIRWWDYSKMKFNYQGRMCLLYAVFFGIGGVFIKVVYKEVFNIFSLLGKSNLYFISILLLILFIIDIITTIYILSRIKVDHLSSDDDNSHIIKGILYNKVYSKIKFTLKPVKKISKLLTNKDS